MNQSTRDKTLAILKCALIIFAAGSLLLFLYQSIRNVNKFDVIDLTSYIRASGWLFDGANPYQAASRRFLYPLFLAVVIYPLKFSFTTPLGKGIVAALWALGSYAAFFVTIASVWKRSFDLDSLLEALKKNIFAIAIIVTLLHPSFQDEFLNGQVNLFVMAATAAFFIFTEKDRPFIAALFLAIATAIKIAPALCLLYVLFNHRWRSIVYFLPLLAILTIGLPWLVNHNTLDYYRYFATDVLPGVTNATSGFRTFSILSTIANSFGIAWSPSMKMLLTIVLMLWLFAPVYILAKSKFAEAAFPYRLATFGTIVTIIPLVFPMSEAHHLLLQIIPLLAIIHYWRWLWDAGRTIFRDRLSWMFIVVFIGLHIGHGLKDTPLRLLSLILLYIEMLALLSHKKWTTTRDAQMSL